MSLIQCPECNKEISDVVKKCPFCGYPIKKNKIDWGKIKKLNIGKKPIILCSIFVLVLLISVVSIMLLTSNVTKAKKFYNQDSYKKFSTLEKKMTKKEKERFGNYLEKEVLDIVKDFEDEKISGKEAVELMEYLLQYSDKTFVDNYSDSLSYIESLDESREVFQIATEAEKNNEYIVAYNNYKKVIEKDAQYKKALEKAEKLKSKALKEYKKQAETKANENDYDGAITLINAALRLDDGAELKSLLEQYKLKKEELKKAEEAAARQKALLTSGKVVTGQEIKATFKGATITKNIYPDNRSGYYTYYFPQDDSKIYLDIVFRIQNISNYPKNLDSIFTNVQATYNSTYKYNSYNLYYSDSSDIDPVYMWDTIDALGSYTFHLAIAMPEEIASTQYPITVEFVLDGEKQILEFR